MIASNSRKVASGRLSHFSDRIEYRLLVAVAFLLCLVSILPRRLFGVGAGEGREGMTILAEAHSMATAAIGYAFIA
jgi:hypothetical protein